MRYYLLIVIAAILLVGGGCGRVVQTGLDRVERYGSLFGGKRIGIISNHTGRDGRGRFIADRLGGMPEVKVVALFGPEHGFEGVAQDGVKITDQAQSGFGAPIYSLYGQNRKPTSEMLAGIDLLVFDIQDVGARFYTYTWTMALAMEAAAEAGIDFVVLDRPNPINGVAVEGTILQREFATFVGLYPIATRHGMTIGELAGMFNGEGWLKNGVRAKLTVIPMRHYRRGLWYDQTGLAFIPPSPNMTSLAVATVYPGTCLLEGTNLSEGRGTPWPFLQFGAPWVDGAALAEALNGKKLPGIVFEPVTFTPTLSKFSGEVCHGARIRIIDRDRIDTTRTGLAIIQAAYQLYPESFEWRVSHFDRLCGTDRIRTGIIAGESVEAMAKEIQTGLEAFKAIRRKYLIYPGGG